MVHLHRELLDASLAPYMGQYFQQLRYLHSTGVRWLNKRYETPLYTADLRIDGDHLHVRLWPKGGLRYEFFTSEHVSDVTLASPGHDNGPENSYVCGSATRARFTPRGRLTGTNAVYSTSLPSDPSWLTFDCEFQQTKADGLLTWESWQKQRFFEHCWHPNNDGKSLVTSTQAQAPGWSNRAGMYSPYCMTRFQNVNAFVSDVGLDVPPALYTRGGVVAGAPLLEHSWIYWRRAAVHTASGRAFFIATDNYGRFFVYPVKDYGAEQNAIPPEKYKVYTPPYPGWVTVPNPDDFYAQFGQWLWRFNKDATKCVSVPYHSEDTEFQKFLLNGAFMFCAIDPATSADIVPQVALAPAHEDTPGLVEFGIAIEIIGPDEMDFVAHFTLLRNTYFNDDNRFIFDAAYFSKDVEAIGIAEDTLMTAEVECFTPPGYFIPGPAANDWSIEARDACRMLKAEIAVYENNTAMVKTERFRMPSITPAWFQFPTLASIRNGDADEWGLSVQPIPTTTGTRFYSPAGPIGYNPDGHAVSGRIWNGPLDIGVTYGYLYALELSTLSLCYEIDDEVAGTFSIRTVAYGSEFYRYEGSLGYTLPAPTLLPATVPVPSFRPHQAVFNFSFNTDPGQGFSTHPHGHWAFNLGGLRNAALPIESDLDWISVFAGKDKDGNIMRVRYKHKDLFNAAFKQTRDYSFYHEPFVGRSLGDYGSFRTAGIWVTFR